MASRLHTALRMALLMAILSGLLISPAVTAASVAASEQLATVSESVDTEAENPNATVLPKKTSSVSTVMADNNVTANLLQTTLGLLTVLALIAAAAWAVKRFGGFRTGVQGQMKIVGGVSLGTRERVVLLQVGEQQLVLGVSPGQIRTLHVLDEPLPGSIDSKGETTGDNAGDSFAGRFQAALKQNAFKGRGNA